MRSEETVLPSPDQSSVVLLDHGCCCHSRKQATPRKGKENPFSLQKEAQEYLQHSLFFFTAPPHSFDSLHSS
uniref:Uncharacterized protein n=1 Tax=Physcomitrium patens TaxID=3218 RepID=A0A2K1J336_PHYPA|nr:hypothetical protein PHYPA_021784 [Physcomitrium patens]